MFFYVFFARVEIALLVFWGRHISCWQKPNVLFVRGLSIPIFSCSKFVIPSRFF